MTQLQTVEQAEKDELAALVQVEIPREMDRLKQLKATPDVVLRELTRTVLPLLGKLGHELLEYRQQIGEVLVEHDQDINALTEGAVSEESQLQPDDAKTLYELIASYELLLKELIAGRTPTSTDALNTELARCAAARELVGNLDLGSEEDDEDDDEGEGDDGEGGDDE